MPPTEKYTKCDIINGMPWYINLKQKAARKITIGRKNAIYYRTQLKNGRTRKNYLDTKCKKIGTMRFWNYISNLKHHTTYNARGLKKKRRSNKNKTKTRKKYKGGASLSLYQPQQASILERLQNAVASTYRNVKEARQRATEADDEVSRLELSMSNPEISKKEYPYCDRLLDRLKHYFMNPPLNPELINEFIPTFRNMDDSDHWNIKLIKPLIKKNKPINYRPNFTGLNGYFIHEEKYNINVNTEIGSGTYSTIYNGDINGLATTFKVPVEPNFVGESTIDATNLYTKYANEFFTEQYTHSELFCNYRDAIYKNKQHSPTALIPSINFIYKYINNESLMLPGVDCWKYVSGIEPLGGTLNDWLYSNYKKPSFVSNFINMITSICNLLAILQSGCNFHHRDLHAGNIMYNKMVNPDSGDISYVWYIIDFGMSTLEIDGIQIQAIHSPIYNREDVYSGNSFISNHGHDLRILFLSITPYFQYLKGYRNYFDNLYRTIKTELIINKCWLYRVIHYNGYYDAHKVQSIETTPQEVLDNIEEITDLEIKKLLTPSTRKPFKKKNIYKTRKKSL